ncbi:MAG: hypothetical protein H7Y88_03810 [Phycisphaerales bacterium]|nr:hypothetical protein [Phycisphaerales bacterium]
MPTSPSSSERAIQALPDPTPHPAIITSGVAHVVFAYDIGLSINLDLAQRNLAESSRENVLRHTHRAPQYFQYRPAPVRIERPAAVVALGRFATGAAVACTLYDFGAISICYDIPLDGPFEDMLPLSEALYDNPELLADSRRHAEALLNDIRPAVGKALLADLVEDYVVYHVASLRGAGDGSEDASPPGPESFVKEHRAMIAKVLRSDRNASSRGEMRDAMSSRIAYSESDYCVIDWNAALLLGPEEAANDVRAVLEFANVELLEMRYLDDRLDAALDASYEAMGGNGWVRAILPFGDRVNLAKISRMQVDHALLFEGVNNSLKLLGDQYLARVYRKTADRLHLPDWDASVLRKLETVETIYEKIHDRQSTRRMEVLEWIIILLFVADLVIALS